MTRNLKSGVLGASVALLLSSPGAFGDESVSVSSLSGLRTAIDNAPASGRTITLEQGVYDQSSLIYIQGKQNLTITGATSDPADTVIRGPGINDDGLWVNIKLNNSDDVTLKNLTLRDSFYHAVQLNNDSDRFTADNLITLDNGSSGFKITSPSNASGPAAYSDDGSIGNSVIGFTRNGQRGAVEGVDIIGAKGWRVHGNEFENIRKPDGRAAYAVFAKGNSQDIVFENNIVRNSFIGLSFGGGGTAPIYFRNGDTTYETRGGVIRNNLIHDVDDAGIYMSRAHDFEVYGNTVINSGAQTGAIESRFEGSSGIIRDNRLSGPVKLRNGGTAITRNNTFVPADTPLPDRSDVLSPAEDELPATPAENADASQDSTLTSQP